MDVFVPMMTIFVPSTTVLVPMMTIFVPSTTVLVLNIFVYVVGFTFLWVFGLWQPLTFEVGCKFIDRPGEAGVVLQTA